MNVALEDLKHVIGASNKFIKLRLYLNIIKRIIQSKILKMMKNRLERKGLSFQISIISNFKVKI